jgi:hypothetical protein
MTDEPLRSANLLVDRALSPENIQNLKSNPEKTLKALAEQVTKELPPPAYLFDVWIYRIVVISLGIVVIAAVVGTLLLMTSNSSISVPDIVTALGAAAIGALAGLLAPSPLSKR